MKLGSGESLAEGPTSRRHVVRHDGASVTAGDLKREALTVEVGVALPVLAPVSGHGLPSGPGPLHGHSVDLPRPTHVSYQNQVEIRMTVDGEPYSSLSSTRHPPVRDGDDPGPVHRDALVNGLRQVEVLAGRVAPTAGVAWEGGVRRAEVGRGDDDRAGKAAAAVSVASELVAGATTEAVVEEGCTQCCSVCTIPLTVKIPISTSPTHGARSVTASIKSSMGIDPASSTIAIGKRQSGKKAHQEHHVCCHFSQQEKGVIQSVFWRRMWEVGGGINRDF